jgi:hypothetical protein
MARIAILDRADMNAEQARVYDAAKQSSGIGWAVLCLYPLAEIVRALPKPASLSVVRAVVAARADCKSCRSPALECSISVVRSG